MQGVFALDEDDLEGVSQGELARLSANWGDALDPIVDEETQQNVREQEAIYQRARRVHEMRGAGAAGPAPPPPQPTPIPVPPPARFTVRGMHMLVLKGDEMDDIVQRPGKWGHYVVPYVVDTGNNTAKPFKQNPDNNPAVDVKDGFPGQSADGTDKQPKPDSLKCKEGRDFIVANPSLFWEVGLKTARDILEKAEAMDLAFARRMEGFGSVGRSMVWDCLDPDYDASDREAVMAQFIGKYLERFYSNINPGNTPSIESVSAEALHKHKVFCKAWTEKHYKTLTPMVTAPAEALASEFYSQLESYMQAGEYKLTRMDLARLLMRHPDFAPDFASALHFFSGSLEQSRGGRNASYKQINMMGAARVASYKKLGTLLAERSSVLKDALAELCTPAAFYLHPWTVDWYDILGQIPSVHRYFEDPSQYKGISERGRGGNFDSDMPPWLFGRG